MIKRFLSLLLILSIYSPMFAQQWVVPAENGSRLSPSPFDDASRKAGADLYNANCKSCHGDPGKNNAIKLVPAPPDMASAQMQNNSDGALHYKISQGRTPMPSFKNILSATDTWRLISYIRSFNDKYVQKVETKPSGSGSGVQNAKIAVSWIKENNQIQAVITAMKEKVAQPVSGAAVKLFAKRYFGNLPIDETRNTDAQGKALFNFPKDLPGDSAGFVQLIVKLSDEAAFGEVKADTTLAIGVPTYRPPLNEKRAIWNVVQKAPYWILISFILCVLTAWGIIFYVLFQIRAIYIAGIKKEE